MFVGMCTENKTYYKNSEDGMIVRRPKAVNSTRAASKPLLPASEAA